MVITRTGILTAVAVAVENDHTIAFLGNSLGEVYKVRRGRYRTGRVVWKKGVRGGVHDVVLGEM